MNQKGDQEKETKPKRVPAQETLRHAQDELEQRVAARTRELHDTVDKLQVEIAERKQAQEKLLFHSQLLDVVTDSVIAMDMEGNILYANEAALLNHGYSKDELLKKKIFDIAAPGAYQEKSRERMQQIQTGFPPALFEGVNQRKDGSTYPVEVRGKLTHIAGQDVYLGVARDITERKQVEDALREREAKFRAAIETSGDGFCITDMAGRFLEFNEAYVNLLGYSREDLLKMSVLDIEAQLKAAEITATIEKVKSKGHILFETKLRSKDGRVWSAELNLAHWPIADGRIFVFLRDITERKRAEDALRQSEERLRLAQQVARIGTFEWDIQTGINTWTPELETLYGLPPGGFVRTQPAWEDLIYHDDRPEALRRVQRALDTGEPTEGEWRVVWPDESIHWVAGRWQMIKDESGKPLRVTGVNIDITELKRAEQALRESEERFRKVFENAPTGIAITDWEGRFQQCNPAYSAMLGYTEKELRRLDFASLVHPEDRDENLVEIRRLQAGEKPSFEIENRYIHKDGQPVWVHKFVSVLSDIMGRPAHLVALVTNVTNRKQAEEALRQAHDKLEQRVLERTEELHLTVGQLQKEVEERLQAEEALSESREQLRYLSSQLIIAQEKERQYIGLELHDDFGQLLLVLKMQLRAIQRSLSMESAEINADMENAFGVINEIVERIRRLSRSLRPSVLEDIGLSTGLKLLFEDFQKYHGLEFNLDMDDIEKLFNWEHQILIYRIFQESLSNVVRHSEANGVTISIKKKDGQVAFEMQDNGKGFDLQEVLANNFKSRGLGLAAIEERVRMMQGDLKLWSQPRQGTRLQFTVPAENPKV